MIKAARLITGEYMICNVVEERADATVVQDALIFELRPAKDKDGKLGFGIGFQPLIPAGRPGQKLVIKNDSIMFIIEDVDPNIVNQYNAIISPVQPVTAMPQNLKLVK